MDTPRGGNTPCPHRPHTHRRIVILTRLRCIGLAGARPSNTTKTSAPLRRGNLRVALVALGTHPAFTAHTSPTGTRANRTPFTEPVSPELDPPTHHNRRHHDGGATSALPSPRRKHTPHPPPEHRNRVSYVGVSSSSLVFTASVSRELDPPTHPNRLPRDGGATSALPLLRGERTADDRRDHVGLWTKRVGTSPTERIAYNNSPCRADGLRPNFA